jgi:ubiquitin-like 1-activating enzyme E1 B
VCTIRSTPDKPIHCIVWAKHLFNLLFGVKDDENTVSDVDVKFDAAGTNSQKFSLSLYTHTRTHALAQG